MLSALSTRRFFRKILIASLTAATPVTVLVACTAGTGPLAGTDAEGGMGQCRTERTDAGGCESFTLELLGDPTTCGFDEEAGAGTFGSTATCNALCGRPFCSRNGSSVICRGGCAVDGRRYEALDDAGAPVARDVGSYLARMAFFEAASVDAFALLRDALRAHGAPASLVRSCERARRDEVRHARMAARLARRHGGTVIAPPPALHAPVAPTLEAVATENAVEGCIRETFGVLLGMWQAERASTPSLRAFFATLAADESRHAALAHRVDAWLRTQLSASARARVDVARDGARRSLGVTLQAERPAFTRELGLPTAAEGMSLLDGWLGGSRAPAMAA